jgi:hypothetical protein
VREGSALLQGIATCGTGWRLHTHYAVETRLRLPLRRQRIASGRFTVSTSADWRSSKPWPTLLSRLSLPQRSKRHCSRPATQANHDAALSQWLGSGAYTLRGRTSRASLSDCGARKSASRPRAGNRMGESPRDRQPQKRNCAAGSNNGPARLAPSRSRPFRGSVPIFASLDRDNHHDRIARTLRTLLEEVMQISSGPKVTRIWLCWRGGASRHWMFLSHASGPWDHAPTRIRSRYCAV